MIIDNRYTGLGDSLHINPLQEMIFPHKDHFENVIVAAPTSSGKSMTVTMLGDKFVTNGIPIIYLGSFKTLVEEKKDDSNKKNHPWKDVPQVVITGDYAYTDEMVAKCEESLFITMTPESLVSKIRNITSPRNAWIKKVGAIFIDEIHLVGDKERGSNIEAALMKLSEVLPNVQLVAMSATIPNVEDLADWFTALNGRTTYIVKSDYRPVKLEWSYYPFINDRASETRRIDQILEILGSYKEGTQFLIGVFKKQFGESLKSAIEKSGYRVEFHNSQVPLGKRTQIIQQFKGGTLPILIATSGYFTGVNSPAEHVIITHTEAGGGPIGAGDLNQLAGRAGRTGYHEKGYVHVLCPSQDIEYTKTRIALGEPVLSSMGRHTVIATHFLGAVYMGHVRCTNDFVTWYKKSLAYVQENQEVTDIEYILKQIVKDMTARRMLVSEEDGLILRLTPRGRISAQMMVDPYQFFELIINAQRYLSLTSPTDLDLAQTIGVINKFKQDWFPANTGYFVQENVKTKTPKEFWLSTSAVLYKIRGMDVPYSLFGNWMQIYQDIDRLEAALLRASAESEFWDATEAIRLMFIRINKGVSLQKARVLVEGFNKRELKKFESAGIETLEDIKANKGTVASLLSSKRKNIGRSVLDAL